MIYIHKEKKEGVEVVGHGVTDKDGKIETDKEIFNPNFELVKPKVESKKLTK